MQQQSPKTITGIVYGVGVPPYTIMGHQQQSPHFDVGHLNDHNQSVGNRANNSRNLEGVLSEPDPQLIQIINAISSSDTLKARAAINELTKIIDSADKQAVLRYYEDLFVHNVLAQCKNQSQVLIAESLVVYQPMLSILSSFFQSKSLGHSLSITYIKNLMAALLNLMADQKLHNGEDGKYNGVINVICLKVLDKAKFTYCNCALIRLLRETCPGECLPNFTDLLMKCIWRNVKMLPKRANELNYDAVLLEAHKFMSALPTSWWQTRPSDTPLRTVKTVIFNMAKVKGSAIMQHLSQIPTHSELHAYLIVILKNLQREGNIPPIGSGSPQRPIKDVATENAGRLLNPKHETMSHIFELLCEKDTKQQGLYKLYELKSQHPDLDLSLYLKGACDRFQKFIEEGMAAIERNINVGDSTNVSQQMSPLKARTMLDQNGKQANNAHIEWLCEMPETLVDMWDERDLSDNEEFADLEEREMLRKCFKLERQEAREKLKKCEELQKHYGSECREKVEICEEVQIRAISTVPKCRGKVNNEKVEQSDTSEHRKNLATNEEVCSERKYLPAGHRTEIREIKSEKMEHRDRSEHRNGVETHKNLTLRDFAAIEKYRNGRPYRESGEKPEIREIRAKSEGCGVVKSEKTEQRDRSEHRNGVETHKNLTLRDFAAIEKYRNGRPYRESGEKPEIREIRAKSEDRGGIKNEKTNQRDKSEHRNGVDTGKNLKLGDFAANKEFQSGPDNRKTGVKFKNSEKREDVEKLAKVDNLKKSQVCDVKQGKCTKGQSGVGEEKSHNREKQRPRGIKKEHDDQIEKHLELPTACRPTAICLHYSYNGTEDDLKTKLLWQKLHRVCFVDMQVNTNKPSKGQEKPVVRKAPKTLKEEVNNQNAQTVLEKHQAIVMGTECADELHQREQDMQRKKAHKLIIDNHKASSIHRTFGNEEMNNLYEKYRKAQVQKELDLYDQRELEEMIKRVALEQQEKDCPDEKHERRQNQIFLEKMKKQQKASGIHEERKMQEKTRNHEETRHFGIKHSKNRNEVTRVLATARGLGTFWFPCSRDGVASSWSASVIPK